MRTFQFSDAKSHKFWSIDVQGASFTVTFGRIGTAGRTQTKSFATPAAARAAADKLIAEKTGKGYVETAPNSGAATAEASEVAAFESALIESPDDLAGWCAYADYLVERNDPRGEFMQVQIALEDEARPKKERDELKTKEEALLKKYEREWLGGLAPFVLEEEGKGGDDSSTGTETCWERGVLSALIVERLSTAFAQSLATDPAARFVRELRVYDTMRGYYGENEPGRPQPRVKTPPGVRRHHELFELIGSPLLANLRHFQLGGEVPAEDGWCDCHTYVDGLEYIIASMRKIEIIDLYCKSYYSGALFALTNLTHLRELRIYHLGSRGVRDHTSVVYALDVLANNPTFSNLTHLLFHPHFAEDDDEDGRSLSYIPLEQVRALVNSPHLKKLTHLQLRLSDMGDEGVSEIIASGILKRLVWLDLRHGCVTDEGARLLAASPDAKRLERIDLSRNAVSAEGLAALRKAGVNALANNPLTGNELEEREYLREGDSE